MSHVCGPIDDQAIDSYRCYFCSRCFVHLSIPRVADRNSWLNWIAGDARQIAECPLLLSVHEKIARIFAESKSYYAPVTIDVGTIACPDCSEPMVPGDIESNPLRCPQCASMSASYLGISCFISEFAGENTVSDLLDRHRAFLRLKTLSQPKKRPREAAARETFASEAVEPLWDRELDG